MSVDASDVESRWLSTYVGGEHSKLWGVAVA